MICWKRLCNSHHLLFTNDHHHQCRQMLKNKNKLLKIWACLVQNNWYIIKTNVLHIYLHLSQFCLITLNFQAPSQSTPSDPRTEVRIDKFFFLQNGSFVKNSLIHGSCIEFLQVRKRSFVELEIFKNRWKKAVREDTCWIDPYQKTPQQISKH